MSSIHEQAALDLGSRQGVLRDAAPDWPSGQVVQRRLAASQAQPSGPFLRVSGTASSIGRGRTSTSSLFLAPNTRGNGATCPGMEDMS